MRPACGRRAGVLFYLSHGLVWVSPNGNLDLVCEKFSISYCCRLIEHNKAFKPAERLRQISGSLAASKVCVLLLLFFTVQQGLA